METYGAMGPGAEAWFRPEGVHPPSGGRSWSGLSGWRRSTAGEAARKWEPAVSGGHGP